MAKDIKKLEKQAAELCRGHLSEALTQLYRARYAVTPYLGDEDADLLFNAIAGMQSTISTMKALCEALVSDKDLEQARRYAKASYLLR